MGMAEPLSIHPFLKLLLILSAIFVISSSLRMAWITQHQLELAHQSLHVDKQKRALVHYERAIHPYLPLLPAREQAMREMKGLCQQQEKAGNLNLALEGWRRLRGALLSSRSIFGQPNRSVLSEANRHIARLAAQTDVQAMMSKKEIQTEATRFLSRQLKDINGFWGVMQVTFLLLWVGLTCWLIWNWTRWETYPRGVLAIASLGSWLAWLESLYLAG